MDGWMDGWINKNPETTKYPGHYLRPFNIVYMSVRLLHELCRGVEGVKQLWGVVGNVRVQDIP